MRQEFEGFVPPTRNYFPMPNTWIDICSQIDNLAELKVIQYVLRHTWGYKEYDGTPKAITTDEFMNGRKYSSQGEHKGRRMDNGTGLSNRSVIDGLRRAVDHKYLICVIDDSDKGRVVKAYALNMVSSTDSAVKDLHTRCEDPSQPYEDSSHLTDVKVLHSNYEGSSQVPMKNLHSNCEETTYRSEKETLERNSLKKRKKEKATPAVHDQQPTASLSLSQEEISPLAEETFPLTPVGMPSNSPAKRQGTTSPAPTKPPDSAENEWLARLTEEQADFWFRWCAWPEANTTYALLSEKDYRAVCQLAEEISTAQALQEIIDLANQGILALCQAKGIRPTPPHLGNLVKVLPTWRAARSQKTSEEYVYRPGGIERNITTQRLQGQKVQELHVDYSRYERLPDAAQEAKRQGLAGLSIGAALDVYRQRWTAGATT